MSMEDCGCNGVSGEVSSGFAILSGPSERSAMVCVRDSEWAMCNDVQEEPRRPLSPVGLVGLGLWLYLKQSHKPLHHESRHRCSKFQRIGARDMRGEGGVGDEGSTLKLEKRVIDNKRERDGVIASASRASVWVQVE